MGLPEVGLIVFRNEPFTNISAYGACQIWSRPFRVAVKRKAAIDMLELFIPYSDNDRLRYDTVFALPLLHQLMSILLPIFVSPLLGFLSTVKPHLKLLPLVFP